MLVVLCLNFCSFSVDVLYLEGEMGLYGVFLDCFLYGWGRGV